jgi:hypothetical protein
VPAVTVNPHTRARIAVGAACVLAFGLHLLYLDGSLMPDEGGFAMVAHWWGDGSQLYGAQWVDRPPGLIATFRVAGVLGPCGVRLLAGLLASGFVLAAAYAGRAVRGQGAAAWAAWAALFLMCTPLTQTYALNGELIAATWTMTAIAASVGAVRPDASARRAVGLALVAGAAAAAAVLTKQNFVDGAVFLLVLGLAHGLGARLPVRRLVALAAAAVAGFAVPTAAALTWATRHGGAGRLVYAMYGFRVDAAGVMAAWSHAAPDERMRALPGLALQSGIATLVVAVVVVGLRHLRRRPPVLLAGVAAGLVETAGIVLGGNYWPHYLIGLSPVLALAAGAAAVEPGRAGRAVRALIVVPAVVVLATSPAAATDVTADGQVSGATAWLRDASAPGDSLVVLYSHANLLGASGLRPAYPYAWSLPIRTLDPDLVLLRAVLEDPARAPTWVVAWDGLQTWGLDSDHSVEAALAGHYRQVALLCGHPVWLRDHVLRDVAEPDPCTAGR